MQLSIDSKEFGKFLMVGDKVLVKPTNPQVKTKSGLLLPPLVQEGEKLQTGYVIRINQEKFLILPHSAILMLVRDKDLFE